MCGALVATLAFAVICVAHSTVRDLKAGCFGPDTSVVAPEQTNGRELHGSALDEHWAAAMSRIAVGQCLRKKLVEAERGYEATARLAARLDNYNAGAGSRERKSG